MIYFSRIENDLGSLRFGVPWSRPEFSTESYFGFKGKVHLNTLNDYLTFEGDARVNLTVTDSVVRGYHFMTR